jgi:flagellin
MSSFRVNTNISAMGALRNLSNANAMFSQSVTRLSTGMRINSGADDPAGLQISEGFRAQISGIDQALRNNSDAMNFAKTAEGALSEVNRLLREARSLTIANSNDATLSTTQKQANQQQLNSILSSIDRISTDTQYGTKKLLNGSAGVTAAVTDTRRISSLNIGGTLGTSAVTANAALSVNVTTAAVKASSAVGSSKSLGAFATAGATTVASGEDGIISVNGTSFKIEVGMTATQISNMVNAKSDETGVSVSIVNNAGNGAFQFSSTKYGTVGNSVQVVSSAAGVLTAGSYTLAGGVNAAATVTAGAVSGTFTVNSGDDGLTMRDAAGNKLVLTEVGNAVATNTVGQLVAGSAQFQIGANLNQTVSLSLGSTSTSTLGLGGLDIMSTTGSSTSLAALDSAIESISKLRGNIGNFMRNTIDSNTRALSVAKENLQASESSIRDIDIAEEMAEFTKYQILQQSGLSVLSQANQAPQAVLSLLRG